MCNATGEQIPHEIHTLKTGTPVEDGDSILTRCGNVITFK